METIKIVSGVIDEERLTLITDAGNSIYIPQGDKRLKPILEFITEPVTLRGEADLPVSLLDHDEDKSPYAEFEKASEGQVSFFRVAKKAVGRLLRAITGKGSEVTVDNGSEEEHFAPRVIQGNNPNAVESKKQAIEQIMSKAVPAASPEFASNRVERQKPVHEDGYTPEDRVEESLVERMAKDNVSDTIVAVVDGEVIPGMEMIESQFKHALSLGSTQGVTALLRRLGAVISKRGHNVDDVLRFMQRGDMRVDDFGNIIAMKALRLYRGDHQPDGAPEERFVDCHTGKVQQWVGAYVQMNEKLVDHNRGQECSSGLHIARRGYLRGSGFGGDVCVLVLLAPEDVIAVPYYDANKVRACRYRIVAKMSDEMFKHVKANRPISACEEGKVLLGNVTAGNYPDATHTVEITGGRGEGVIYTRIAAEPPKGSPEYVLDENLKMDALPDDVTCKGPKAPPVSPLATQETVNLTRAQIAKQLYDAWVQSRSMEDLDALWSHKRACRASWDKLGVPNNGTDPVAETVQKKTKGITVSTTEAAPKVPKAKTVTKAPEKPTKAKKTMTASTPSKKPKTSHREDMATLLGTKKPEEITTSLAQSALSIKQAAKKSWTVLGVSPELERAIKKRLDAGKW